MPGRAAQQFAWPPRLSGGRLDTQGGRAGSPDAGAGLNTHCVGQSQFADGVTKDAVVPVTGVRQHNTVRRAAFARLTQLCCRHLRFGRERYLIGYASALTSCRVFAPFAGQIELICDGQTGVLGGNRQAHGDLTVVLLA
uniref:Uncharacterized protein n=1 Tax=Paraburkholderia sprentiae WSM5005 TaxID=754502 RepID=A0A1I9YLK0_9BURK